MATRDGYEGLSIAPVPLDHALPAPTSASSSMPARPGTGRSTLGEQHGYRNAQATVIAPTGTIGLVMDCDTTGIEPDFALVKFKKLAGGGYFKIINRAVPEALRTLGYARERDRGDRSPMRSATARSTRRPAINHDDAARQGLHRREDRQASRRRWRRAFDIKFVFNKWTLGEDFCTERLGFTDEQLDDSELRSAAASRLLQEATSRPPTSMSAAR